MLEEEAHAATDLQHFRGLQRSNSRHRALQPLVHLLVNYPLAGIAAVPPYEAGTVRSCRVQIFIHALPLIDYVHTASFSALLCFEPGEIGDNVGHQALLPLLLKGDNYSLLNRCMVV